MIKAVIFDAGGVIIKNPWPTMLTVYSGALHVTEGEFMGAYKLIVDSWQEGNIDEKTFWEIMKENLKVEVNLPVNLWFEGFIKSYCKNEEMLELAHKLQQNKIKTALLSNTEKPIMEFLKKQQYKQFDYSIFSCEVGMIKPHGDIYRYALSNLETKPEETLFIDDSNIHVQGAKALGIKAILFENNKNIEKKVKEEVGLF